MTERFSASEATIITSKEEKMGENVLQIPYSEDLLLSLKESKEEFEQEARFFCQKQIGLSRLTFHTLAWLPTNP